MKPTVSILGIDLASAGWRDNGAALLSFDASGAAGWLPPEVCCLSWPEEPLTAWRLAQAIDDFAVGRGVAAVGLDGPQGWREPEAGNRKGVGRACEYEVRAQGKTGEFGRTYPRTQSGWIRFCIEVFAHLLERPYVRLADSPDAERLPPIQGGYYLLEVFPTSAWRSAGLSPLPGKSRMKGIDLTPWARALWERFGLPPVTGSWSASHDDLQAVVAALPGAALLGAPCIAIPRGKPSRVVDAPERHRVEGLIWDVAPSTAELPAAATSLLGTETPDLEALADDGANPILVDERDDTASTSLYRGVDLFHDLIRRAAAGVPAGVGYAQFVCLIHGTERFADVAGRPYSQADTRYVLGLAEQVTVAAGGPARLRRKRTEITVGMDAFIWRKDPPHRRPAKAFDRAGYGEAEWLEVFPDGLRRLLDCSRPEGSG